MAGWKDITNVWKNVREVDLRPIREEALRNVNIAIVGLEGSRRQELADHLRSDPQRPDIRTQTPIWIDNLEAKEELALADLLILIVDGDEEAIPRQRAWAHQWSTSGKDVLVFYDVPEAVDKPEKQELVLLWDAARLVAGPLDDTVFLLSTFATAVMDLLPDHHLSLARHYPLLRGPVAQKLINDTCMSNAAYSLSTGLAEVVPILGIPLNIADMVVLTKAQAFLVYRLGLALGFSTQWQDYVSEFGSVIGGGFLWRQLARSLVGLVPVWGIAPKVAVAYAGTYVVGHVVLRWYMTGRHVTRKQIQGLYRQAFGQGKTIARELLAKAPRPRLGRRKADQIPAVTSPQTGASVSDLQICPNCGKTSAPDALFCQYCGQSLVE
ncbi:MAG TPA: zinc-ribbon domain-containing protein [Anaerolineales bacterium]